MADAKMKELLALEIFVEDRVNELAEMDDDPEFLNETLNDFFEQMDTGLQEMSTFRSNKQFKELGEKAHFLKGSSLALGCERIGHIFETMQHLKTPSDDDIKLIDLCMENLPKFWKATKPYLDEYIIDPDADYDDEDGEAEEEEENGTS